MFGEHAVFGRLSQARQGHPDLGLVALQLLLLARNEQPLAIVRVLVCFAVVQERIVDSVSRNIFRDDVVFDVKLFALPLAQQVVEVQPIRNDALQFLPFGFGRSLLALRIFILLLVLDDGLWGRREVGFLVLLVGVDDLQQFGRLALPLLRASKRRQHLNN